MILYCRVKKRAAAADIDAFREKLSALQALSHPLLPKVYRGDYARGLFFWVAVAAPSGRCLRDARRAEPDPLPPLSAVALAHTLAEALDWAYDRGFAHFALAPEQIYVDDDFVVTAIVGLGIRMVLDAAPSPPGPDELVYRAPEQIQKLESDYRADIYALGMILYELLAGDAPYADQLRELGVPDIQSAPDAVLSAFNKVGPTRLCEMVEGLDSKVELLVQLMSAKSLSHRTPTWKHVIRGIINVTPALALASAFESPEERAHIERDLGEESGISLMEFIARLPSSGFSALRLERGGAEEKPAPLLREPPAALSPPLSPPPPLPPRPTGASAPRATAELPPAKRDEKPHRSAIAVCLMAMVTTLLWLVSTPAHVDLREPRGSSPSDPRAPTASAAAPHASTPSAAPVEPLLVEVPRSPASPITPITPVTAEAAAPEATRRPPAPPARRSVRPAKSAALPSAPSTASPASPAAPTDDPCGGPFRCHGADP